MPPLWPKHLDRLVGVKSGKLKHELTESLRTSENSVARARVGVLISDTELMVREARQFVKDGPPNTVPNDVIGYLAERFLRERLQADDAFRASGIGIDLTAVRSPLRIPTGDLSPAPAIVDSARGMTLDDLELLKFGVDRLDEQLRLAVALRQPPEWIGKAVDKALEERGIAPPDPNERRQIEFQFLGATQRAFEAIKRRNGGEFIVTPPPAIDPAEKSGPTLSDTFEQWKRGTLLPGMKVPRQSTAAEAEYCVRRFRELNGNPRIGAITREQARSFRDALWRLPTRLPDEIERQPMPAILDRADITKFPRRSAGTLGKHITLIAAILNKGATAHDLKFKGSGWSNPFEGLKPENHDERDRVPFTTDELNTIFTSSIFAAAERPEAGQGEAAFWLPALAVMTGARLSELAQLRLNDLRKDALTGVEYFDINTEGRKTLKNKTAKRAVPVHSVLVKIGWNEFVASRRRAAANDTEFLFPGLDPQGDGQTRWGVNWSKWFNRWRKQQLGIDGGDGARKDFHSFRHTFKDMCRAASIHEEVHDALTGNSFKGGGKGVGRRYGNGVPLSVRTQALEKLHAPAVVSLLQWVPPQSA